MMNEPQEISPSISKICSITSNAAPRTCCPAAAPIEFDVWIRKNQSGAEEVDELLRAMIEAGYHDGYNSTALPH